MWQIVRLTGGALLVVVVCACSDPFYCTPGAATWTVTVTDSTRAPVTDLRWNSVIVSTQDTIPSTALAAQSDPSSGLYAVFIDDAKGSIDPRGETVRVEGASALDWFSAEFVFDVPKAECYANKVSGPDTVVLAPATFALAETGVWGGGNIRVVSPVLPFHAGDSLRFVVGGDTVWSAPLAGDTAFVPAPVNSAQYDVALLRGEAAELLGTVTVYGYGGYGEGPPMTGVLMPWPPNSPDPTFLSSGPNQLQLFDAASRTVVHSYPDSIHNPYDPRYAWHCPQGIGPTYDEWAVVLCPQIGTVQAWNLEGDPVPIDVPGSPANVRMAALVAPGGRWIFGLHHQVDGPYGGIYQRIEEPQVMRISPKGDRIVVAGNGHPEGVLVYHSTPSLAYTIPMAGGGLRIGAGFSADGETLYAAGQGTEMQVTAVNADDGTVLASREGPHIYEADLLVDWQGRYVFIVGIRDRRTLLMVLDAQSLETIAEIQAPDSACDPYQAGGSNQVGLVHDQTLDRVYAVWATAEWQFAPPVNSCIQRFDLW